MSNFRRFGSKTALSLFLASTLAACGGSSSSGFSASTSFDNIIEDGSALSTDIFPIPYTDPSTLPTSGSATYNGYIAASLTNSASVAGDLELVANFASDDITGSASNFFDDTDNQYGGALSISNSVLDRDADTDLVYTFSADLDGTLTSPDGDIVVDGFLDGDFTGTNYRYVEGIVNGTATFDGSTEFFDGEFVAER